MCPVLVSKVHTQPPWQETQEVTAAPPCLPLQEVCQLPQPAPCSLRSAILPCGCTLTRRLCARPAGGGHDRSKSVSDCGTVRIGVMAIGGDQSAVYVGHLREALFAVLGAETRARHVNAPRRIPGLATEGVSGSCWRPSQLLHRRYQVELPRK